MRLVIFSFLFVILISGCKKEDEREVLPIEGKWNLLSFSIGMHQEIYNKGEIVWEFNKYDELIVTINTTLPSDSELPVKQNGTYPYVASKEVISIGGTQYAVSREAGILKLDHNAAADGTLLVFELAE